MSGEKNAFDPGWAAKFKDAVAAPEEAVRRIRSGSRVFIGTGCARPAKLVAALAARAEELTDVEIVHLLTVGDAPYADRRLADRFHVNSFFISDNVREIIQEGLGDYTPIFLSDIPRLLGTGRLPLDAALIQVTPPDERGMCSLGVSVDIVKTAAENASVVIAEVNPRMPRTLGDSFINALDIDALVPVDYPVAEYGSPKTDETTMRIAQYVSALVDDGSTVELGIGRIPHAVAGYLKDKKDLGIHTEMFTDALMDLVEAGVVTGARKSVDRGKIVASFCMGTQKLYDYIDGNPVFSFHPTEYVNDPALISRHHKMTAINVALEIDLTGQVCADSIGGRFFSGIGGQVDFNRGAARAPGGKAVIAMPSTAKDGKVSRIVVRLSPGAGVVTTRGDVHYVVTEHGVAYLHGKSVQERALALISIAHPDYREGLLKQAVEAKYIPCDLAGVGGRISQGPTDLRGVMVLGDGTQISFRPVKPTDEPVMRELFRAVSPETLYYRFMSRLKTVSKKQIQNLTYIDHRSEITIVGTLPESYGEEIIAIGGYFLDKSTNRAEVAFMVRDEWQKRGIGKFLCRHLAKIARRNGIKGLDAEVLSENRAMQAVFNGSGLKVRTKQEGNVAVFEMDLD